MQVQYHHFAYINLKLTIPCESCGEEYTRVITVSSGGEGWETPEKTLERKILKLQNDYLGIGVFPCPKCKHVQSWNTIQAKKEGVNIWAFVTALVLTVAALLYLYLTRKQDSSLGQVILFGLIMLAVLTVIMRPVMIIVMNLLYRVTAKTRRGIPRIAPTSEASPTGQSFSL